MSRECIVLKGEGHIEEGTLASGVAPKPGQLISLDSAGKYVLFSGTTGERAEVLVVVEDDLLGVRVTTAYTAGGRVKFYCPLPGDHIQVLVKDTQDATAIGQKLIVEAATGKCLSTTGTVESEPFTCLVALGTITADTLCLVRVSGQ